jgi:hypothetical protein
MAMAVAIATIDAQYSHPPFGRNMKYPTRAWTVTIATVMRAITAMHDNGVARPTTKRAPAMISVLAAITACCFGHFIPMLLNHEAVPVMLFALLIPW